MAINGVQLRIQGKVQGVGFRPFVWQLAKRLKLRGHVSNDGAGVLIHLAAASPELIAALREECPPLARIDAIIESVLAWDQVPDDFSIIASSKGAMSTQIAPDAATCPECLRELNSPDDRRFNYPFLNCTHCGPRLTIIRAMPYDRPYTAMAAFPLCPACASEYQNPADRRFHAQPIACPQCGPQLSWHDASGELSQGTALAAAVAALRAGNVVAIKGLGGFHLACLADNDEAVARLRERKRRPAKPLAVMVPYHWHGHFPEDIRRQLGSPAAPIVLTPAELLPMLSPAIAPGLNEVGTMLPANPIQHLILQAVDRPLVMTSGNLNGQPPVLDNDEALRDLAGIADGWLLHNRDIIQRMDDSLVRADGEMLRRSRGYVPDALTLPPGFEGLPPVLAMGADLKNTFCMLRGNQAVLSQHFGDLTDDGVEKQWRRMQEVMRQIYDFTPLRVAIDAHPGYRSSQMGRETGIALETVLHHHAHAAGCMAEHGWPRSGGPLLALTLDGIGWGEDGALWGAELLKVTYRECERLGGLPAVALPGGDRAAREPWRNLLAQAQAYISDWQDYPELAPVAQREWQPLMRAIQRGINAPLASSAGRLFDAVAAALNIVGDAQSYEGEAACRLEALAQDCLAVEHPVRMPLVGHSLSLVDFWHSWLNWQATPAQRAWAFHDALAAGLAQLVNLHSEQVSEPVLVCSGGVMHNRLLRQRLRHYLPDITLWFPHQLPAGDGGISFGQAVVTAARILDTDI